MSIDRKFPINVDPRMKGILEAIYGAIDELQRRPSTATLSASDLKTLASQAATQAAGLIGPFATPVIGQGTDPALAGIPTGNGTVTGVVQNNSVSGLTMTISNPSTTPTINLSGTPNIGGGNITSGTINKARLPASGWTAWTGSATRTSFDTATATLANVAEAVKALVDDLCHA